MRPLTIPHAIVVAAALIASALVIGNMYRISSREDGFLRYNTVTGRFTVCGHFFEPPADVRLPSGAKLKSSPTVRVWRCKSDYEFR